MGQKESEERQSLVWFLQTNLREKPLKPEQDSIVARQSKDSCYN